MKQQLIYTALFTFALATVAPVAIAHGDDEDKHDTKHEQRQDSGAYNATGDDSDAPPTDPDNPAGPGTGGSSTGGASGGGAGTGTSGGAGSTGAGTGGAGTGAAGAGGASGAGAGAGG